MDVKPTHLSLGICLLVACGPEEYEHDGAWYTTGFETPLGFEIIRADRESDTCMRLGFLLNAEADYTHTFDDVDLDGDPDGGAIVDAHLRVGAADCSEQTAPGFFDSVSFSRVKGKARAHDWRDIDGLEASIACRFDMDIELYSDDAEYSH